MYTLIPLKKNPKDYQLYKNKMPVRGIRYDIDEEVIKNMAIPDSEDDGEWQLAEHSRENLLRLTPHTQKNKKLKIVLIIKKENSDGVWLKGVLKNETTCKYSLISSMDKKNADNYQSRKGKTMDKDWSVCWAQMIAPWLFWNEFKNRLS